MTNQASEDKLIKSKTDWSTPYDEWLIPILNRFRYGGAIECRAIPSEIQLNIESIIRTEKLKLLEQVEAAIDDGKRSHSMAIIRTALTKLEAEL